jgi:hypothetical protein
MPGHNCWTGLPGEDSKTGHLGQDGQKRTNMIASVSPGIEPGYIVFPRQK